MRKVLGADPAQFPYTDTKLGSEHDDAERHRVGCFICPHGCSTEVWIKGGRVVNIEGNPDDPFTEGRTCPKLRMATQMLYHPQRNKYPLKRVGRRGEGRFERITWEQALDEIAARLKGIRDDYGGESLGMWISSRSAMVARFIPAHLFAQLYGVVNEEKSAFLCQTSGGVAAQDTFGFGSMPNAFTRDDLGAAKLYMCVGGNPAESQATGFGLVNDQRLKNGAPLIVADPRQSMTAAKADLWLKIRPGTDMALGLGLIHHLIANDLYDRAFVSQWTVGFERLRDHVLEKGYDLRWASRVTDIPLRDLEATAEAYASLRPAVILGNTAIGQHTNAYMTHRTFMLLSAIAGNIGRKGGCYAFMGNGRIEVEATAPEALRPKTRRKSLPRCPISWIEAMLTGEPYPLKGLVATGNILTQWGNTNRLERALDNLDLFVHLELFPNEASQWADYVMPIASWIEAGGPAPEADDRRFVWVDRLVDPPGEARSELYFWTELGRRLGWGEVFREEMKDPAWAWDLGVRDPSSIYGRGLTAERLRQQPGRWLRGPIMDENHPGTETLYLEGTEFPGTSKRFPTPSGKVELWTPDLEEKLAHYGLSALPVFYTERENLAGLPYIEKTEMVESRHYPGYLTYRVKISDEPMAGLEGFDTYLITGRAGAPHFHTITHWWWQPQEMMPDMYAQIHPTKARSLGLEDGDTMEVETLHGRARARAWVTEGIREDTIFMPIGWGARQPFNPWETINRLTDHFQFDPVGYQCNLKTYACRVRAAR